jgi:hypothetical protein
MTLDHIFVRCEQCRNHGKCKNLRDAERRRINVGNDLFGMDVAQ